MRSPPDADLVAREPDLPGLATVLDPDAFVETLRAHVPNVPFGDARVTHLRYEPGTQCLVAYAVEAQVRPVDVYAVAHRPDAATKLRNAREKRGASGPFGLGRFVVDDQALVVSFFPNDRRLRILPALVDPKARRRLFAKVLPEREELWDASIETIRYRPERRYSAQIVRKGRPRAVLKLYGPEDFWVAARGAKNLHSKAPLRVPRRIAKSAGGRLLVFKWLDGPLLEDALSDPRLDPEAFERVGRALEALHAQSGSGLPVRTPDGEAASLLRTAADLGYLWPPLAERTWDLAGRLAQGIVRNASEIGPIHGDFQAEHVLLAEDEIRVVDLDEVGRGDPALDLGNFLAHLELDGIRGLVDRDRLESFRDAFLHGYHGRARNRANAATAAALVRLSIEPFRDREPNWPETMAAILARAEDLEPIRSGVEATA